MNTLTLLDRRDATVYATWFRCLADPTRVLIVNLLASARRPMRVGEVVEAVGVGQSTVSHHLRLLAEVGFVVVRREGTASLFEVNAECLTVFPSAADLVMGRLGRVATPDPHQAAPWYGRTRPLSSVTG